MSSFLKNKLPKDPPSVSVIVPCHNSASHIQQALDSIAAQQYPKLEIIVVDDFSQDETIQTISNIPVSVNLIRLQSLHGAAGARNIGLKNATGAIIAFLDADDFWSQDHLIRRVVSLIEEPCAMGSRGTTISFRILHNKKLGIISDRFIPFHLGATLFRRELFDRIGLFDESLTLGSDADFYFRCRSAKILFIEDKIPSLFYRKNTVSLSNDHK